jgi:glycosyltransferase involved in cell wall biosynthesis
MLHNHYVHAGGKDRVVETERALLAEHGHAVDLLTVDNSSIRRLRAQATAGLRVPYSLQARRSVHEAVRSFRPDLVHLHNFFPLLAPSVLDACAHARLPVVHTLHNYRLACPGASSEALAHARSVSADQLFTRCRGAVIRTRR